MARTKPDGSPYPQYGIPGKDGSMPPTDPGTDGGTTPPDNGGTSPIQPNIFLPPGVDPYYGLTISNLQGSSGNYIPPTDQEGIGGGKATDDTGWSNQQSYLAGDYNSWARPLNGNTTSSTGGSQSSGFQIATPNMTWLNSLPTVMPANGQAMANAYGPSPYSNQANTPQVPITPRPLTYNNPYNTNPYLPLSNPFALVPNNIQ